MLLVAVNKKFTVTTCACFHPQDQCARAMMGGPPQAMVQGGLPQATVQPVAMVPMQVVVPPDAQGGGQMIMGTPSGPMQVIVPVGLNPGDQFVAQVPSSMPVANTSAVMPVAPVINSGLVLVRAGSPGVLRFDHFQALQAGMAAPLTCNASHPGNGIGTKYPEERMFGEWRYTESKMVAAQNACMAQLVQGKFIKRVDANLVLDVAFWVFQEGTAVNWVGGGSDSRTYLNGGGRDFRVNPDGSISLVNHPHLALGVFDPVDVPARVALGEIVLSRDAEAYCASLPRQRANDYGGCRRIKCPAGGACGWCSCCVAYSYAIGNDDCLCFPLTCVLFPLPFFNPMPFVCSCERQGNQWITRGEHHDKTGAWVIVDAEKKTIAAYGVKCCSEELEDKPACYCVK